MRGFICPGIDILVAVAASERDRRSGALTWAARFARSASARAETTFTPSRNRAWSRRRVRSSTSQRTSSWGRARGVGSSVSMSSNGSAPAPQRGRMTAGATARLARTRPSVGPSAHAQPRTSRRRRPSSASTASAAARGAWKCASLARAPLCVSRKSAMTLGAWLGGALQTALRPRCSPRPGRLRCLRGRGGPWPP